MNNINKKNILIVDDDINTSLKYKKWLEEEGFNLTLINDPDGFDLYHKLHEMEKKVQQDTSQSNDFKVCFMSASRINYPVLVEMHPEFGEECYVCKEVPKEYFIKHVYSLIS
jgi:hypothetical protein